MILRLKNAKTKQMLQERCQTSRIEKVVNREMEFGKTLKIEKRLKYYPNFQYNELKREISSSFKYF